MGVQVSSLPPNLQDGSRAVLPAGRCWCDPNGKTALSGTSVTEAHWLWEPVDGVQFSGPRPMTTSGTHSSPCERDREWTFDSSRRHLLPFRSMVGRRTLTPLIPVRIWGGQPTCFMNQPASFSQPFRSGETVSRRAVNPSVASSSLAS